MITVYPQMVKEQLADKRFPIALFVCLEGEKTPKPERTKLRVFINEWDPEKRIFTKDMPDYKIKNTVLRQMVTEREKDFLAKAALGESVAYTSKKKDRKQITFMEYAEAVGENKARFGPEMTRIAFYDKNVQVKKMDWGWLKGYEHWLRESGYVSNKGNPRVPYLDPVRKLSGTAIHLTMSFICSVLVVAHKEGILPRNPHDLYKIPPSDEGDSYFLIESDLQKMVVLLGRQDEMPFSRYRMLVYFLLGCFSGLRYSDWVGFDPAKRIAPNGRAFVIRAQKNNNLVVMPIGPSLSRILTLLPKVGKVPTLTTALYHIERLFVLAGIETPEKYGTHTGRHSFGALCARNGLSLRKTAQLLGDSEEVASKYYHLQGIVLDDEAKELMAV